MSEFICYDCGAEFDDPREEMTGVSYAGIYERCHVCPECGSDNFGVRKTCENCGEPLDCYDDRICDECFGELATLENALDFGGEDFIDYVADRIGASVTMTRDDMLNATDDLAIEIKKLAFRYCIEYSRNFEDWVSQYN